MSPTLHYLLDTDMCIYLLNGNPRVKALLRRNGRPVGDIDLLIAGVAMRHGLTIVTNNTAHFDRLPDLTLENWLEPPQESF